MFRSCETQTVPCYDISSSSSDDEDGPPPTDAMLGGLRMGINTIRSHTRATIGKCATGKSTFTKNAVCF